MTAATSLRIFNHPRVGRVCVYHEIRPGRRTWCFRSDVAAGWYPCLSPHPKSGHVDVPLDDPDPTRVEVSGWTVLMAIRYGLNRATAAHDQALVLIRQHWPALKEHRRTLLAALEHTIANPHPALTETEQQASIATHAWLEAQQ